MALTPEAHLIAAIVLLLAWGWAGRKRFRVSGLLVFAAFIANLYRGARALL